MLPSDPLANVEASDGPFPWKVPGTDPALQPTHPKRKFSDVSYQNDDAPRPQIPPNSYATDGSVKPWGRLPSLVAESEATGCIAFRHAPEVLSAGKIFKHVIKTIEALFAKHSPMIFKIGWTHDPVWRWSNKLYGYQWARDAWSNMVVLHVSGEPHGPAMLEASLIDKYGSTLFEFNMILAVALLI